MFEGFSVAHARIRHLRRAKGFEARGPNQLRGLVGDRQHRAERIGMQRIALGLAIGRDVDTRDGPPVQINIVARNPPGLIGFHREVLFGVEVVRRVAFGAARDAFAVQADRVAHRLGGRVGGGLRAHPNEASVAVIV